MLLVLHGIGAFKVAIILAINYFIATAHKPPAIARVWPAVVIVLNMFILFVNEKCDGYKFAAVSESLAWLDAKSLNGLHPRWHVNFNITMLRIVSFALDAHWRVAPPPTTPTDQRTRTAASLPDSEYSFLNYFAYAVYPPLYIAGPIMTFNDFVWQLHSPVRVTARERISYAIRFLFCFLTMEFILHTMYVIAIKDTKAWMGNGPADLSLIGFWNLVTVWLKVSLRLPICVSYELTSIPSFSSHGASSVYGRSSMVSTHPRTWSAVLPTTIRLWASGVPGTGATTSGLCGTSTSHSAAPNASCSPPPWSLRLSRCGTTSVSGSWPGAGLCPCSLYLNWWAAHSSRRQSTARNGGTATSRPWAAWSTSCS